MTTANAIRDLIATLERAFAERRDVNIGLIAYANRQQILSALRVAEVVPEIEDAIEQIYSTATDPRANVGFPPTRKELEGGLEVIKAISGEAIKLLQSAKEPTP